MSASEPGPTASDGDAPHRAPEKNEFTFSDAPGPMERLASARRRRKKNESGFWILIVFALIILTIVGHIVFQREAERVLREFIEKVGRENSHFIETRR